MRRAYPAGAAHHLYGDHAAGADGAALNQEPLDVKDLLGGRRFSCRTALGHVVFVREKGLEFRAVPEAIDIANGRD
jgi:hypothetical protein